MTVRFLDVRATYGELGADIDAAYERVMGSGRYVLGEEVEAFEAEYAAYCGVRHCVAVGDGLAALALTLRGLGVGPGDDVIVPSNTFIATWLAVSLVGARLVPVEPSLATFNLDPELLEAAITPETRAVIAVHLYGQPANVERLRSATDSRGIVLIEDAAQAHGATRDGRRAGSLAHAGAFSFYPAKNLGAFGDGGAVTTDDDHLAARIRMLRNYGASSKYVHEIRGVNSRLDPLQAAFLRAKLGYLDDWNDRRRRIAGDYQVALAGLAGLAVPGTDTACEPAWHLFVVRTTQRDQLQRHLAAAGIESQVHYPTPPHLAPAYADHGWSRGDFPRAEQLADTVLSVPIGPHLSPSDAAAVVEAVQTFAGFA